MDKHWREVWKGRESFIISVFLYDVRLILFGRQQDLTNQIMSQRFDLATICSTALGMSESCERG